ncbi:helix-turn-helix domain-containing protein [Spirosoma sp. HMF4905]|uniref:Helix-turn-helix domain-containing protein n=1 Tax=Spirosoma arboris TaxID=2682092 RepID=A0A7K1SNG6_9BACT|nr:helix-turn-helix domain-containing protein [Spirosoma arboris]MVM35213.1 helix-turn-helix domain-containing protein [Spirosoma arboris]
MYCEIKPCPELTPFINCYWSIDALANATLTDYSFPDGCPEIIFNLETQVKRFSIDGRVSMNPSVEFIGQMTQPYQIRTQGRNRIVGVRFYPHTVACFTKETIAQFNDQTIAVQDIWGTEILDVAVQIAEASTPTQWVTPLNAFFRSRLTNQIDSSRHKLTDFAVRQFLSQKDVTDLDAIVRASGLSHRYLQQCFHQRVGISPKMLLKIIRFQKTFQYLNAGAHSLTYVAYECGYYDQAHFIRDFNAFTGSTPARYSLQHHPFNQHFLVASNSSYLYNF